MGGDGLKAEEQIGSFQEWGALRDGLQPERRQMHTLRDRRRCKAALNAPSTTNEITQY